jgi:hypothetical protein
MRDARRRNRNIGTAKSGHGKNNKNVIPERWADLSVYWQTLNTPVVVTRTIHSHDFTFIVEPPREDCRHCCTVEDVCEVLRLLPIEHVKHIDLIVFRQPTRKQNVLASVWGRLGYWSEIAGFYGPGIYLEAQSAPQVMSWPLSQGPDQMLELERLRADGHEIRRTKRSYEIAWTSESIRATQLYRTVPHELGHYVDYLTFSDAVGERRDSDRFWELYNSKPHRDKEAYAHRYADEFRASLISTGNFPFRQIRDEERMLLGGLNPDWFPNIEYPDD